MKASEFKTKCLSVLDDVERTGEPVLVMKHGRIVAKLTSARVHSSPEPWKRLEGMMAITGDIDGPAEPPEAWNAVRGILKCITPHQ